MSRLISLGDVRYALGYTPYDAANPSGFLTQADLAPFARTGPEGANFYGPTGFTTMACSGNALFLSGLFMRAPNVAIELGDPATSGVTGLHFHSSGGGEGSRDASWHVRGGVPGVDNRGTATLSLDHLVIRGPDGPDSVPAPPAGCVLQAAGGPGAPVSAALDGFAADGGFKLRRADGSANAPAALRAGSRIGAVSAHGHTGIGYTASAQSELAFYAAADWTGQNQPTYCTLSSTPPNSNLAYERLRVHPSGNVSIGGQTDDGLNRLQITGSVASRDITANGTVRAFTFRQNDRLMVSIKQSASPPTLAEIQLGEAAVWHNTNTNTVRLYYNLGGGALVSVALS